MIYQKQITMTTAQLSNQVRSELKKEGFNKFSVTVKGSLYDQVVKIKANQEVTIDELVSVEKFASKYKDIDFDMSSNEILRGGNTLVQIFDNRNRMARWSSL